MFSLTRTPVCHNAWCRRARNSFDCSCVHLVVSALLIHFIRCHLAYFMSLGDNMHKLTLWSTRACNTKHARNLGSGWSCMGLWKSIPKSYASLGDFRSTLPIFVYTWPHALSQSSWPCMCMPCIRWIGLSLRSWWHISLLHYNTKQQLYIYSRHYTSCLSSCTTHAIGPLHWHVNSHVISCHSCQWTS